MAKRRERPQRTYTRLELLEGLLLMSKVISIRKSEQLRVWVEHGVPMETAEEVIRLAEERGAKFKE